MSKKNNNNNTAVSHGGPIPLDIKQAFAQSEVFYKATLQDLNGSGVTGEVILALDQDTSRLTLIVSATGLEPNQVHIQHIHGFVDGSKDATIPTLADDTDGDGFIELLEGAFDYGPIVLNAAINHADGTGSDNGHTHADGLEGFPTAPTGAIRFAEIYQLPTPEGLGPNADFEDFHFVIHGLTTPAGVGAGTPGEVDGTAGYKLVLPVAIGELELISARDAKRELQEARVEFARERSEAHRMDDGAGQHSTWHNEGWMFG